MNILVVTAYPPVLHRHGGGVRMYHNIRILGEKHSVHVLSFVGSDEELDMLETVKPVCESVRGIRRIPDFRPHWLSVTPFMVREISTPEMHQAVDGTLRSKQIQALQCEYLQMAQFRRKRVFSLLTAHEVQSKNAHESFESASDPLEKLRLFYRWMQMLRYEVAQVRKFDRVVTMTNEDASYLKSYAPEANIRPIPIGIDVDQFSPFGAGGQPQRLRAVCRQLFSCAQCRGGILSGSGDCAAVSVGEVLDHGFPSAGWVAIMRKCGTARVCSGYAYAISRSEYHRGGAFVFRIRSTGQAT